MLNEALRLIRVYHDMKQTEAAEKLGVSKSYLSEIEGNRKKPTLDLIEKYSVAYNIPVSSILFFSEQMETGRGFEGARTMVASKVLRLLKFLEARSDRAHAE